MRNPLLSLFLVAALAALGFAQSPPPTLPSVEHYRITADLHPEAHSGSFAAELRIKNSSKAPVREVPLLLYRLFVVDAVQYQGHPAAFRQGVVTDQDEKNLQVDLVRVKLSPPLPAGGSGVVRLTYSGELHGYTEAWAYVHDTIAPEYSLLRLDTFFYPLVSLANGASRHSKSEYTYQVEACVPQGLTVAAGGRPAEPSTRDGKKCFAFSSFGPTWRIDVAAAKFSTQADSSGHFRAYVLPGHEEGAVRVLEGVKRATQYFSELFGPPQEEGYTAIEIPDGWGSQASDYYFLQTAAAFEDPKRINEVYHEIGHGFDVQPAPSAARARFFDEALASYFESLAVGHFEGPAAFERDMEQSRVLFVKWADYDKKYAETPIAEYGKQEMGQLSYSKGAYALFVLHRLMGEEKFRELVRTLRRDSQVHPVDFKDFQRAAERVAQRDLKLYFEEWIFGSESTELLRSKQSADQIIARYR